MPNRSEKVIDFREIVIFSSILVGIVFTQYYNYLLFHSITELFGITISVGIFVIGWNSRKYGGNSFFLVLGISFLFVGTMDALHTLAYKGMGVFPQFGSNLPTQFWIAARYLQACSLGLALAMMNRKIKAEKFIIGYCITTTILIASIFLNIFPTCYIDVLEQLTLFKIISEYVIDGIFLVGLLGIYYYRTQFDRSILILLSLSILVTMSSEVFFTLYTDVYGIFNLLGHVLKVVAFYLLYKAIIQIGLERPFSVLFRQIKLNEDLLSQKTQELERSNKELENFASIASHDLQEPLRKVVSFLQLLQQRYGSLLDDKAQEYINIAVDGGKRMQKMISDLLQYSRISTRGNKFILMNLETILTNVLSDLQLSMQESGAIVTYDPLPALEVDKTQMEQLFLNLLSNAIKFRGASTPTIHISAKQDGDAWVISIQDNGIGIDMAYAKRLFQIFQRLHTRDEYPGTGIGLAVCKRIVERHGGQIWVESQPGEGSTFSFKIPLRKPSQ